MNVRLEHDSLGSIEVPNDALYGSQTQRAVENFQISDLRMPRAFIRALGLIKAACARVNGELKLIDAPLADAISQAALRVANGDYDDHFPVDVFQTGSGTSSNMNANEVIAKVVQDHFGLSCHPNDHVNHSQSSNDVIPTAIHVSALLLLEENLLPALLKLHETLVSKANSCSSYVKTGRTHLMDAMPIRLDQEILAWAAQIQNSRKRVQDAGQYLLPLAQGGTAVGTGINAHPEFASSVAHELSKLTNLPFKASSNHFESISSQDAAVGLSGQLKTLAVSLMKIANDLRWMNSGPLAGLGEITLPTLQPGSSIMPGKVNPVIPEAVAMVAAQVMGCDTTVTVAGQSGNFQLNVMLPVIAYNLLLSIELLTHASTSLGELAIQDFVVNEARLLAPLNQNPILVTALNNKIGYEKGAMIAKKAYQTSRPVLDVALEETDLTREELEQWLNPRLLTNGGIEPLPSQ